MTHLGQVEATQVKEQVVVVNLDLMKVRMVLVLVEMETAMVVFV